MAVNTSKIEFQKSFGEQIERLRTEQNLSFRQLAQRCDLDYSDISKIEKGERNIQLSTVLQLAKGLGIHPKKLFDFAVDLGKE